MTNYEKFLNHLKSFENYITNTNHQKVFPSLSFYKIVYKIISRYANMAKNGKFNHLEWSQSSYEVLLAAESCGGSFNIQGFNYLKGLNTPVVFLANHMSTLENFILPCLLLPFVNYKLTFVVKKELLTYPIFNHIMKATNPIALNRQNPREDLLMALTDGYKKISAGYSIIIYPQATRRSSIKKEEFNSLATKLAERSMVPLVPVALKTDFCGNNNNPIFKKIIKDFGPINPQKTIYFLFGEPAIVKKETEKEILKKSIEFIQFNFEKWQN